MLANSDCTTAEADTEDVPDPVRATDKETTQLLTYSLSGADMDSFTIKSDTSATLTAEAVR